MSKSSNSQHLDMFHISPCPLPYLAVAHSPSSRGHSLTPFSIHCHFSRVLSAHMRLPHVSFPAVCWSAQLMIPLSLGPRESGFPGAGCRHRFLTLQHSTVRIGEIDDYWGISDCFLFALAFVCKPRNALCVSLTLPSQAFRACGRRSRLPKCLCAIPDGMLLRGCLQVKHSARSPSAWAHRSDQVFPAWCSGYLPGTSRQERDPPGDQGCVVLQLLRSPRALKSHKNRSLHPTPLLPPQISYLYEHFLVCLSSHTAQSWTQFDWTDYWTGRFMLFASGTAGCFCSN